jgi:hypothetical protein
MLMFSAASLHPDSSHLNTKEIFQATVCEGFQISRKQSRLFQKHQTTTKNWIAKFSVAKTWNEIARYNFPIPVLKGKKIVN